MGLIYLKKINLYVSPTSEHHFLKMNMTCQIAPNTRTISICFEYHGITHECVT